MGDPRRRHKKYRAPKKKFELQRIKDEAALIKKYGLKNKKEIWKAKFKIDKIRKQAKSLINKPEEQIQLIKKLKLLGFRVNAIDDVLALTKEDLLERRLQTVLVRKGLARTPRDARQLIVHKHVAVNNNIINIPSFIMSTMLEDKITIIRKIKNASKKTELPTEAIETAEKQD
jgi:small subunit ribosomal protein S4